MCMSWRPLSRIRNGRGSVLIEILLSVVILSTSLTFIIRAMGSSAMALEYGARYTLGLINLENQTSDILRRGFIAPGVHEEKELTETKPSYHYSLTTTPWQETREGVSPISQVDIKIVWRSGKREDQVTVQTLLPSPKVP